MTVQVTPTTLTTLNTRGLLYASVLTCLVCPPNHACASSTPPKRPLGSCAVMIVRGIVGKRQASSECSLLHDTVVRPKWRLRNENRHHGRG